MDFGALPPEINSGLMYAGPGAGPMLAAAAAWEGLAADLYSTASSYGGVVSRLASGPWTGPSAASMAAAAAPYVTWLNSAAGQAEQTATQARAAAAGYEAAFAATVPPPVIAANRSTLATLVATNFFGQNSPAIAATEAQYGEMWAQDAAAMYGYAGSSSAASTLTPFAAPPQNTNPGGLARQAAAVAQATGSSAGTNVQATGSQVMSAAPQAMQGLTSSAPSSSTSGLSGILNTLSGSGSGSSSLSTLSNLGSLARTPASIGSFAAGSASLLASLGASTPAATELGGEAGALGSALSGGLGSGAGALGLPASTGLGSAVSAGLGHAGTIGALSVPQSWATAAPAIGPAAGSLPSSGLGAAPGFGGGNPGSLLGSAPLANIVGRGASAHTAATPRFDMRPSVVPRPVAAG
jgi:PPE-repeat protein